MSRGMGNKHTQAADRADRRQTNPWPARAQPRVARRPRAAEPACCLGHRPPLPLAEPPRGRRGGQLQLQHWQPVSAPGAAGRAARSRPRPRLQPPPRPPPTRRATCGGKMAEWAEGEGMGEGKATHRGHWLVLVEKRFCERPDFRRTAWPDTRVASGAARRGGGQQRRRMSAAGLGGRRGGRQARTTSRR